MTKSDLQRILSYDEITGTFTWLVTLSNRCCAGMVAGSFNGQYWRICIRGKNYSAHQLAWLYVTGDWPKYQIDHKNGDATDNRFSNLRLATMSQNIANSKLKTSNTSGFKGVYFDKRCGRWAAEITVNYKKIFLGYHASPQTAHFRYVQAARQYFGEFARA